ncbi:MAG: Ig-like domain-containing protein, partial [Spirochaetes bacterium]|nr:Ig-like domain-containing protein [Spirochaetota bacterium]
SWYVIDYDRAGNRSISTTNNFSVDTNSPSQVTLIAPTNNIITNAVNIDFLWNASTDLISGVSNYNLFVTNSSGTWATNVLTTVTNDLINNLADGVYYWNVLAFDRAGHNSLISVTNIFTLDTTVPYFTNLSPTNTQVNVATNSDIIFNLFDNISSSSQSIIVRIAGTTALSNGLFLAGFGGSISASNAGYNVVVDPAIPFAESMPVSVYAYGADNGSNTNSIAWQFTTTDVTPPYFTNVSPTNNQINVATNANVILTLLDNVSASSQSMIVRIEGTTALSNGSFLAGFSGNISSSGTGYSVVVDPASPFAEWTNISAYFYGEDLSGNTNFLSFVFTTTDGTLPTGVTLILPFNNAITNTNNIGLLWSSSIDTGSGISNYNVWVTNTSGVWSTNITLIGITSTNNTINALGDGVYNWRVRAEDVAGNSGNWSGTDVFTVDRIPPLVVTLETPTNNAITNAVPINLLWNTGSDATSGISNYQVQLSIDNFGSIWSNKLISVTNSLFTNLVIGTNWWRVRAIDRVGNIGPWSTTNSFEVELNLGNVIITNLYSGRAWTDTVLRSILQTNIELISFSIRAVTINDAAISGIRMYLEYTNTAAGTDFTNFILYKDNGTTGTLDVLDVTMATDLAVTGGMINFNNIMGFTIAQNTTENYLVAFGHKNMTDTEGLRAIISNNNSVTFIVNGYASSNDTIGSGRGRMKEVHGPGTFKILHAGGSSDITGYINQWLDLTVQVRRAVNTNELVTWYNGVMTLDSVAGKGLVEWANVSGTGIFSNITATTQGYYSFTSADSGTVNFRIRNNTAETLNAHLSSVTGFTDDDTEGKFIFRYGDLAYFNILHMTNYDLGTYDDFVIQAIATNGGTPYMLPDYTGTATISVFGTGATIDWTNTSGAGTLTTNVNGNATFQYVLANAGVVTLNIRDYTVEMVNVDVNDGSKRDLDTEGPLYFQPFNPFIVSMSVGKNGYATVDEMNSLRILFSRVITSSAITNFYFYDMENNPYVLSYSLATNTNGSIPRTEITLTPGLDQAEILKGFWMEIRTNITGTNGFILIDNPFDSTYNVPFYSTYTTLIDKDIGGTVRNIRINTTLLINPNVLPDDAYVTVNDTSPSANSAIAAADALIGANQFYKIIGSDDLYKDISAFNRNLIDMNGLVNDAQLFINYSDTDNDGIVDGTDIHESRLKLFVLNEQTGEWEVVEDSYVDVANNKVYGNISRFGIYTVMGYYESEDFDDSFLTFPNPADINTYDVTIKFYLKKDAKMTIIFYTVTGELVRKLVVDKVFAGNQRHFVTWDGKNDIGLRVVNGVYLLKVKGEYVDGSGKFSKTWKQGIMK